MKISLTSKTTRDAVNLSVDCPRQIVFLRRRSVEAITGLSRSGIYAKMADGTFPKCVRISTKSVRWLEGEVLSWCEKKIKERR
ncbi:helix-turn-helix transcriptional regulator [Undibacterium sp. Ji50W]|uniref:helix-turn-helix transcriptional regulator n=1 Tax=Undibacterium sp. Ji50W TaxID=3413041 RepID=UPI003BF38985